MSDNKELTKITETEAIQIIEALGNSLDFPLDTATVNWQDLREVIAPQGEPRKAAELVDVPITIFRLKPFLSAYAQGREYVYWAVAQLDDGTIVNTVLGGSAVCDDLDRFMRLNAELRSAIASGNKLEQSRLISAGAGRALRVTLRKKSATRGGEYYVIE